MGNIPRLFLVLPIDTSGYLKPLNLSHRVSFFEQILFAYARLNAFAEIFSAAELRFTKCNIPYGTDLAKRGILLRVL